MDNKYYHWGSGEVVEPKYSEGQFMWDYLASLPAIGPIDPSYPVGWVGDDVEMVWQIMNGLRVSIRTAKAKSG